MPRAHSEGDGASAGAAAGASIPRPRQMAVVLAGAQAESTGWLGAPDRRQRLGTRSWYHGSKHQWAAARARAHIESPSFEATGVT